MYVYGVTDNNHSDHLLCVAIMKCVAMRLLGLCITRFKYVGYQMELTNKVQIVASTHIHGQCRLETVKHVRKMHVPPE